MNGWQIAAAAVLGLIVYTVAVAAPLGVLVGRSIRTADQRETPVEPERPALRLVVNR